MVLSNPLPGATTRPPDTQQLPPSQPIIQQLQASTETMALALSSEHPSSLPSPSALSCSQDTGMQQSSSGCIDPSLTLPWATNQQLSSRPCSFSQSQSPSPPSLERESQSATCCKCHSSGARCTACKCCREERPCVNCYPGRRGNCANADPPNVIIPSTFPFQPLLSMTQQSLHLPQLPLALSQSPSSQSPSPHALLSLSNSQPPSTMLPSTPPLAHTVSSLPTSPQPCNPSSHSQRPLAESRQPCKSCREERLCVNCYPGRRGNCANADPPNVVILSTFPFQPLVSMTQQSLHLPQLPLALSQSPLFSSQSPSPHALLSLSNSHPPSTMLPSTPPLAHTVSSLPTLQSFFSFAAPPSGIPATSGSFPPVHHSSPSYTNQKAVYH